MKKNKRKTPRPCPDPKNENEKSEPQQRHAKVKRDKTGVTPLRTNHDVRRMPAPCHAMPCYDAAQQEQPKRQKDHGVRKRRGHQKHLCRE